MGVDVPPKPPSKINMQTWTRTVAVMHGWVAVLLAHDPFSLHPTLFMNLNDDVSSPPLGMAALRGVPLALGPGTDAVGRP